MPAQPEAYATRFEDAARILARGGMIGSAIILPAIRHENSFYQYLTLCIFGISTLVYNALNWRAVIRYYFLALATVIVPVIVTVPHHDVSMVSFLLNRMPVLVMLSSLVIEEYSRLDRKPLGSEEVPMAPLLDGTHGHNTPHGLRWRMSAHTSSEGDNDLLPLPAGQRDALLVHMQGAERESYRPPSHEPSEISLSSAPAEFPPSSYDSMTRSFWHDGLVHQGRSRNSDGGQPS
ncbi:hypothetical protein F4779DRAFT_219444 [Xylariaceae sp. FL0662B]|nr:hypothetical protein F4779DRAFT_219444 [Xylariaceae sp. FL0662B]